MNQIHKNEFTKFLKEHPQAVVEFSSPGCSHCQMLKLTLEPLEEKYPETAFVNVDITEDMELAQQYEVRSVPVTLYLKNGEVQNRLLGNLHPQIVEQEIKRLY